MKTTLALALMGAALISMPAVAQNAASQNSGGQGQSGTQQEAKAPPLYQIKAGQWRATKLDGLDVYNTNNEKIGDISELIVDRSGKIQAVVIGIGGFLGIGEHQVAVPFEQVQWMDQPAERRVSSNNGTNAGSGAGSNATSGSGSSTASDSGGASPGRDRDAVTTGANAPPPGPAQINAPLAGTRPASAPAGGPTAVNEPAGSQAAMNGSAGGGATTTAAPTQTRVDPGTGAAVTSTTGSNAAATGGAATGGDRTANRDTNRNDTTQMYRPDHAVVAMTKDQLQALPEVRYGR